MYINNDNAEQLHTSSTKDFQIRQEESYMPKYL